MRRPIVSETKTPHPSPLPVERGEGTGPARPVALVSKRPAAMSRRNCSARNFYRAHTVWLPLLPKGGEGWGEEANRFRN